jgi:hypothetical protein
MTAEELSRCQREEELLTTSKPIAEIVALAYVARPFILENDLTFLENFELLPPRNLAILRHFTSSKERDLSPLSEREDSYRALYETDQEPVRLEWGKNGPLPVCQDNATLDGLGDLPDDEIERTHPELATEQISSRKKSKLIKAISGHADRIKEVVCTQPAHRKSRSADGVANGSTDGSPSFSDMTFNDNGSLVTKRGGKEAHRTLNRAFERIYSEKATVR